MNRRHLQAAILAAALLALPRLGGATTFQVDPAHTSVLFHIRHLFTEVTGRFEKFEGKVVFDESAPDKTSVEGTIEATSINTNNEKRDKHLRSADFFDVEKYPKITFRSTGVREINRDKRTAQMAGVLSMHGVEKPVVLDVDFQGRAKDPWGNERAGFRAVTTISRKDFGLNWNEALEAGGFLVGDEVRIELKVEATPAEG